ncbi:MAG TPA: gamma-glutamyl-gamma-aminobutyrate hydrolase family protein [Candidatus Paceibacterota bacterium]|nr:gamma-glutamyl-gamma-aminobutyrate hydrolase family protein [Candidatus Paceibacterota bacterium]
MKRVLVVQSRTRPEMLAAEQAEYTRSVAGSAELTFISSLDESKPWDSPAEILAGYDGVIFGGSGEYDFNGGRDESDPARLTSQQILRRVAPLIEHVFNTEIPLLGICYGHQIIAELREGNVTNDHSQKKVGTFEVSLTEAGTHDPLFSLLPADFYAQYGHKDSATTLPKGAELLATGSACKFAALRYGSRIYTTQFHPELRAEDVAWKLENSPGYLPEGVSVDSLVRDSSEASRIIPLWVEQIVVA